MEVMKADLCIGCPVGGSLWGWLPTEVPRRGLETAAGLKTLCAGGEGLIGSVPCSAAAALLEANAAARWLSAIA